METNQSAENNLITLDLTTMPPPERHVKIFEVWNTINPSQTLRIINDHDPKPLHYQFQAEMPDTFTWEYEKSGPEDWIVRITKTM